MSAETSPNAAAPTATPSTRLAPSITIEGLLITAVPGMLTTIMLDAVGDLAGLERIGVATVLGVVLWWAVEGRKRHGRTVRSALEQYWRWALLALSSVAVLALVMTRVVLGVPTPVTVTVSGVVLAGLVALTYLSRRLEPVAAATAATVAGAAIGLCLTIAY